MLKRDCEIRHILMEKTSGSLFQRNYSSAAKTQQPREHYVYSTEVTIIITLLIGLVIVVTIVGNLLVFIAFTRYKNLRTYHNYFILILAIADFAIGLLCIPPYVPYLLTGVWPFGHTFCIVWLVLDYVTPCSSAVNILIIVVDMYLSVRNPFEHRRKQTARRARILMCIPWFVGLFVYGPAIVFWEHWFPSSAIPDSQCSVGFQSNVGYLLFGSTVEFIIPFLAIMVLNVLIFILFHRQLPATSSDGKSTHQDSKHLGKLFHMSQSHDPLPTARLSSNVTLESYQNFAFEEVVETNGASCATGQPRCNFDARKHENLPYYQESMGSGSHITRIDSRHSVHRFSGTVRASDRGMSTVGDTNDTFRNENKQKPVDESIVNLRTTHASRTIENKCKCTCQREDLDQYTALNKSLDGSDFENSSDTPGEFHSVSLQEGASDAHSQYFNLLHSLQERSGPLEVKPGELFVSAKSNKFSKKGQTHGRTEIAEMIPQKITNTAIPCTSDNSDSCHLCKPTQQERNVNILTTCYSSEVILETTQLEILQLNGVHEYNYADKVPNTDYNPKNVGNTQAAKCPQRRRMAQTRTSKAGVGLTLIVVVFGICWAPYQISALIMALDPDIVNGNLFEVAFWLLWLNSTINPILYACVNWRFRIAFRMILCQKCNKNLDNTNLVSVA